MKWSANCAIKKKEAKQDVSMGIMCAMNVYSGDRQPHWDMYEGDFKKPGDYPQSDDGSAVLPYAWTGASYHGRYGIADSLQKFRRRS